MALKRFDNNESLNKWRVQAILFIVMNLSLVIIVYLFYFTLEKVNIITMPMDAFWSRYPIFSFEPFYYLNY